MNVMVNDPKGKQVNVMMHDPKGKHKRLYLLQASVPVYTKFSHYHYSIGIALSQVSTVHYSVEVWCGESLPLPLSKHLLSVS